MAECRRAWLRRLVSLLKPLPQTEHLCGHWPLWTNMWERRSPGVGKERVHSEHLCGFSLTWVILW